MANRTDSLLDLNAEQRRAVTHAGGPLKIVAGAGTGKTGTLTRRFAYLVEQGVAPDRILALTFSRRAAREFRERALTLLNASYPRLWISTFHGFCLRVLSEERDRVGKFGVMGEPERRRMVARAVRDDPHAAGRTYYVGDSGAARLVEDAITLISRTKDEAIDQVEFAEYADRREVERLRELAGVYLVYQDLCRQSSRRDFGDLGFLLVNAFESDPALLNRWQKRFEHVMVDEFQDTNEVQWRLLTLLAPPPAGNLTVVGDGCQAIYAFRGASSRYFDRLVDEYSGAENIVLATNYRSHQNILDVAYSLIASNAGGDAHPLHSEGGIAGEPVRIAGFVDEDAEADYIARSILRLTTREGLSPDECAVLCRSVKQSGRALVRAFTAYGVPFAVRGYDPVVEEALADLCAVLRCIGGTGTWVDAARVLVRRHVALAKIGDGLPEDNLARRYAELLGPNREILRAVPPLDPMTYARVTDWLDGSESWRPLAEVRDDLPRDSVARTALDGLEAACVWLRQTSLESQAYAALALVGRLDSSSPGSSDTRAGVSACRRALRAAHGLARAGLGIPELLGELDRLSEEDTELGERRGAPGVAVLTLHAAKGLEWPAVFIAGVSAGMLPAPLRLDRAFDLDDLARHVQAEGTESIAEVAAEYEEEPERARARRYTEEERRLAYVGCTRARRRLTVTYAHSHDRRETNPSQFIAELESADPETWLIDEESDAGVMLPLDVARAVRQSALAALGVSTRAILPRPSPPEVAGEVVGAVLAAQWTAAQVAGGVPIRFRELPRPFDPDTGSVLTVSYSALDAYGACPRQFFYRYVLHLDPPASGASVTLGSKVHQALHALNQQWMESGAPPVDGEVQEIWRSIWKIDKATIDAAMVDPTVRVPWEPGFSFARQTVQAWRRGAAYLRRYYTWERSWRDNGVRRVPVALECKFVFPYGDYLIDGRIDCVIRTPNGDVIIDYKTGKKGGGLKTAESLQLAIYEQAWIQAGNGSTPPALAYYFLGQKEDRAGNYGLWDGGKQVDVAHFVDAGRDELWARVDEALANIMLNRFEAVPPEGRATCERCTYSTWCEETLA